MYFHKLAQCKLMLVTNHFNNNILPYCCDSMIKARCFTCCYHLANQLLPTSQLSGVFTEHTQTHLLPIRESEAPLSARLAPAYLPTLMDPRLLPVKCTTKHVIQIAHFPQEISFRLILAHNWRAILEQFLLGWLAICKIFLHHVTKITGRILRISDSCSISCVTARNLSFELQNTVSKTNHEIRQSREQTFFSTRCC